MVKEFDKGFEIGEVARKVQLQPSAIRYYESVGLLPAPRRENGRRRYDVEVFSRLNIIRIAQQAGFTIAEIHTLLMAFPENTPPSTRWDALATQKLAEVNDLIRNANAMKVLLERMLRCECATLDLCASGSESRQPHDLTMDVACGDN